jgi:UDP-N-acetylglucosamine 2-epimerase (hydrolysing)
MSKKIVFLTGTRADFGKIKSLVTIVEKQPGFEAYVFVTGMHLQPEYGYTLVEIERCGFSHVHTFENHTHETTMDLTLAKTIEGLSAYIKQIKPDMIVVHGDRVETLAGAIVGSLNNILVAHIEGGELSGTVDELIRHSVSKLSHIHFVANEDASKRLQQMGELGSSIHIIGSPDIDIMFSAGLPTLAEAKQYYDIRFGQYAMAMFHPVTTEAAEMERYAKQFVNALAKDVHNYVIIFPNNDLGSKYIIDAYAALKQDPRFRVFPSLRFEYFLTLLKNTKFVIGNSSAGIREAPYYGIPVINIGTRQQNRTDNADIIHATYEEESIASALKAIDTHEIQVVSTFGNGQSNELFLKSIVEPTFWLVNQQKQFKDL